MEGWATYSLLSLADTTHLITDCAVEMVSEGCAQRFPYD